MEATNFSNLYNDISNDMCNPSCSSSSANEQQNSQNCNEKGNFMFRSERRFLQKFRSFFGTSMDLLEDETNDSSIISNDDRRLLKSLGTFEGVFAPVCLAMFSSLLFLRIGYIVGNAGLIETFIQFGIAYIILVATVLSISAISTNGAIEGGGIYFMISRTVGPEFGGSIGVLFYLANVVSSALYLAACTEGIVENFGPEGILFNYLNDTHWWRFCYSSCINLFNLSICLIGASLFGKMTACVLAVVISCMIATGVSFFYKFEVSEFIVYNETSVENCVHVAGSNNTTILNCTKSGNGIFTGFASMSIEILQENFRANLGPKFVWDCSGASNEFGFFTVFGVLFSSVTGIMGGANMSGELKSPSKSIPSGTLLACMFTFASFMSLVVFTALTCNPLLLQHDCLYMSHFSFWRPIIAIGIILATFSASLSNLIGASRILYALSRDMIFGPVLNFILKGKINDNPVISVMLTYFLVQLFLLMGKLNNIAQLASVLFLLSYAAVNLSCLGLHLASAPNFRPSFKYFSWWTCLVGLVGTIVMMFFINPVVSAIGILLCVFLIVFINLFSPVRNQNWGSISQALLFHQVRKYLLLLDPRKSHIKFWRPQMLLLVANPRTSCSLIDFVNTLKKGGLYVLGHVFVDDFRQLDEDPCLKQNKYWLNLVDHLRIKAFVELTVSRDLREGIQHMVRISGIGAMKPNTILLGFLEDNPYHIDDFQSPFSPFATGQFEGIFPGPRQTDYPSSSHPSKREYVGIITDVLKLDKNVCLCRHFQSLNKDTLFRVRNASMFGTTAKNKLYLDVWLIDFFSQTETNITDITSLFMLQLACIVNMVPRWKKLKLRVFVAASAASSTNIVEEQVRLMLDMLRIRAETVLFSWTPQSKISNACEDVRRLSSDTAVTFLYLPEPPKECDGPSADVYLDALTTLTNQWPPTLLVRGVSTVTLTSL